MKGLAVATILGRVVKVSKPNSEQWKQLIVIHVPISQTFVRVFVRNQIEVSKGDWVFTTSSFKHDENYGVVMYVDRIWKYTMNGSQTTQNQSEKRKVGRKRKGLPNRYEKGTNYRIKPNFDGKPQRINPTDVMMPPELADEEAEDEVIVLDEIEEEEVE